MSVRFLNANMLGIRVRNDQTYRDDQGIMDEIVKGDGYNLDGLSYRIKKAQTVVDVGANIGVFSALIHNLNPQCKIWAVEPNPHNLSILRENIGSYAQILEYAISEKDEVVMALTDDGRINTVSCRTEGNRSSLGNQAFEDQTTIVKGISFTELCDIYNIGLIDILKIDCEGCEETLLANSDLKHRVKFIVGEFHQEAEFKTIFDWAAPSFEMRVLNQRGNVGMFWARNKNFSMLPCNHIGFDPSCKFCKMERTDSRYYHLWTNDLRDFFDARNEALNPVLHKSLESKSKPGILRELPCIHLGSLVQKARCSCPRKDIRNCDLLKKEISQERNCEICMHYEPDPDFQR